MFNRVLLASSLFATSLLVSIARPAAAAEWASPVKTVVLCNETWFEVELTGRTMAYGTSGQQRQVRFMIKASVVGAEKFKQMYAMSLTAFSTQAPVWLGTAEASTTTSVSGGNCGTNNTPAQTVQGMAIYR